MKSICTGGLRRRRMIGENLGKSSDKSRVIVSERKRGAEKRTAAFSLDPAREDDISRISRSNGVKDYRPGEKGEKKVMCASFPWETWSVREKAPLKGNDVLLKIFSGKKRIWKRKGGRQV